MNVPSSIPYIYRGQIDRCVDGDTVDVWIDLGLDISHHIRLRLKDVHAAEKTGSRSEEHTSELQSQR